MKALIIADKNPSVSIKQTLSEHSIDLICTLGDLDYYGLKELEDVSDIPKLGVYGNHCSGQYMDQLGIKNMHLQTFEFGGLRFGGFEGSLKYKESSYAKMYTQEEAAELMKDFPSVDVFLAHSPPFDVNDEPESSSHAGFHALRDYVLKSKPKYYLHGHTYPTAETLVESLGETRIIYVSGDAVITL